MIKRALILSVLLGGIFLFAGLQSFQPKAPPDTRYIKINMQGEKLSSWSGPWSCVFDSKTGLLWEVKIAVFSQLLKTYPKLFVI